MIANDDERMVMDMDVGLDFLLLSIAWQHVFLAPYAKVEESFNLHAVHDVLMYGVREKNLLKVGVDKLHESGYN